MYNHSNSNEAILRNAADMSRRLSRHQVEEHRDWADTTDAWDDLCSSCIEAGTQIRELVNILRDVEAEKNSAKPIRGFFKQYRFLSNFHMAPVEYNGIRYTNNEAAFQAQKCPERAIEFASLDPSSAKRLGRHVKLRPDWEDVKESIMYDIVWAKFTQNDILREQLLKTGYARLFEENTWGDTTWGTVNQKGQNLLGIILEDVRDEFRSM